MKKTDPKVKPAPAPLEPLDPLRRYPVATANRYLAQSNAKTYQDIKHGRLKVIHDGGRTYVPGTEIIRRSTVDA